MIKKDTMVSILQLESARARGEKVSEYTSARVYAECYLIDIIEALDSGVPYINSIAFLSANARCDRQTAYVVLGKVLHKANYIRPKGVAQRAELKPIEIIAPVIEKKLVDPVIPIAEKTKPVIKETKPVSIPPAVKISDSAKYIETGMVQEEKTVGKWDHLSNDGVIGSTRFLGEEHKWASPEVLQKEKDDLAYLRKMSDEEDRRREEREKAKDLKALQQETLTQPDKE